MELHKNLKPIFKKIDFVKRYAHLSNEYGNKENTFKKYKNDEIIKIIESYNYSVKYMSSENFFKINEKFEDFEFQFNLKLKHGICEFIWDLLRNKQRWPMGFGVWGGIARLVTEEEIRYPLPCFESYEELEEILKEAFKIYEDFKRELIKSVD